MTVKAAIEAMRHDSQVWDQVSSVARRAAEEADALTLGGSHLSWASVPTGLLHSYAEIQQKVAALLAEGAAVLGELSITLDEVATAYELSDERAAARFKGVWDVRG